MRRAMRAALAVMAWLASTSSAGAEDETAARQTLRETYTFRPHELTTQQIDEKSNVLDGLWSHAKAQKETYIPVLRSELQRADGQPFFLYDGSMLLLSLSDTALDRRIALNAISRCDLRDVQLTDYFRQVHRLATLGENTVEAALHVLVDPKFSVSIPPHALALGQNYALIYMVLPLEPAQWLGPVLARLRAETEPTAQKSLLLLAWYAQTKDADEAISAFAADAARPAANREYARGLAARNAKLGKPAATAASASEAALRAERREIMKRISDEALLELDEKTAQLAALREPVEDDAAALAAVARHLFQEGIWGYRPDVPLWHSGDGTGMQPVRLIWRVHVSSLPAALVPRANSSSLDKHLALIAMSERAQATNSAPAESLLASVADMPGVASALKRKRSRHTLQLMLGPTWWVAAQQARVYAEYSASTQGNCLEVFLVDLEKGTVAPDPEMSMCNIS